MPLQTISVEKECINREFAVEAKAEAVKAGFYEATFTGMGELTTSEGSSPYYPFWFRDETRTYLGFGNQPKGAASGSNRLGRFLMGLAGKPLTEAATINPADYVGKRYMLVYATGHNTDRVSLQSFTPID